MKWGCGVTVSCRHASNTAQPLHMICNGHTAVVQLHPPKMRRWIARLEKCTQHDNSVLTPVRARCREKNAVQSNAYYGTQQQICKA
eukprot:scaffold493229_cov18-Prasinocladus_malaysianus.AAC.1